MRATPKGLVRHLHHKLSVLKLQDMLKEDEAKDIREIRSMSVRRYLLYTLRGALRATIIGFTVRSAVNLVFFLVRLRRVPQRFPLRALWRTLFGKPSLRWGAMFGSFVAMYRLILQSVEVIRHANSIAPTDHDSEEQTKRLPPLHDEAMRWLLPAVAGAIAGAVAISCEKRDSRTGISQEFFARGLQGLWNAISARYGIRVPYGDLLVYALSLGQTQYAFVMHPELIAPPSLRSWLNGACQVPSKALKINKDLYREGTFDPADMRALMRKDITPGNHMELASRVLRASLPTPERSFGSPVVPCAALHPAADSCTGNLPLQFWRVFRWLLPEYIVAHLGPLLLLRPHAFARKPIRETLGALLGAARTSSFQGVYVAIFMMMFCGKNNLYRWFRKLRSSPGTSFLEALGKGLPEKFIDSLISDKSFWLLGFLSSAAFAIEEKRRREMLNMYIFPRALSSAWIMARRNGWVPHTGNHGDTLLAAIGAGMLMTTYQNQPQHISGFVRRIVDRLVGPSG